MKIVCLKCGYERISTEHCSNQSCHGPQVSVAQLITERDELREKCEGLEKLLGAKIDPHYLRFEHLVSERDKLRARNENLMAALKFYASEQTYDHNAIADYEGMTAEIWSDIGTKAREALAGQGEE